MKIFDLREVKFFFSGKVIVEFYKRFLGSFKIEY